jgi:hypothetical protein
MSSAVLKVASAFGGSMSFNNRSGIGRFGMGMKTAALSLSPVLEVYSWQERAGIYNMTIDVDAIGKERGNLIELPDPTLLTELPEEVADLFVKPMVYPTDRQEQDIAASTRDELLDRLGATGTIVYMPNCDRLTYAKAKTLVDHAREGDGTRISTGYCEGSATIRKQRVVEAFDPTYSMPNARHTRVLDVPVKHRCLIVSKLVPIKTSEYGTETDTTTVKLYKLPIEEWTSLGRKILKNCICSMDSWFRF